jgi:RimJ/RimL family protein N-acetyltransferase
MVLFETDRLELREVSDGDCEPLLAVYEGNSDYLALTEGAASCDLEKLRRELAIARMTPGRHTAAIVDKQSGVLDWLEENPSDCCPWLGLVMVRADFQRRGVAVEAVNGLASHLRAQGLGVLRVGVIDRNPAGRALVRRLGLEAAIEKRVRMASEDA